jgi:peroxiredoxin
MANDPNPYKQLPANLPAPLNDGACDHLPGMRVPSVKLASTRGGEVDLSALKGRCVAYVYPMTGTPGVALPEGWDLIPGARGCTPQTCDFSDHYAELMAAGAGAVFGISNQTAEEQKEFAERLHPPYALLSDAKMKLANGLRLPTFMAGGVNRIKRLTLVIKDGAVEHVFYPVFPPNKHADEVIAWLRGGAGI